MLVFGRSQILVTFFTFQKYGSMRCGNPKSDTSCFLVETVCRVLFCVDSDFAIQVVSLDSPTIGLAVWTHNHLHKAILLMMRLVENHFVQMRKWTGKYEGWMKNLLLSSTEDAVAVVEGWQVLSFAPYL